VAYLLEGLIRVPFAEEPDDLNQLATAVQYGETAEQFYDRLLRTPVMEPVVERFVLWLSRHDPKVCLYDSNDVMVSYCSPHYYVAMCETFYEAAHDYVSGALNTEFQRMFSALRPEDSTDSVR
jgi:hypothetical protein